MRPFIIPSRPLIRTIGARIRHSSTSTGSLITSRSIPAPHCGSIRILGLNNPTARNAISRALLDDLTRHVASIQHEGAQGATRAVILASESDASFCAGADLKERKTFTAQDTAHFLSTLRSTFAAIAALPIPTISSVSSLALGGGLELALTTHLRVFSSSALVALPETRLGIVPGAGGTYRLPFLIGRSRALDLMLTGRRVTGAEAYFMGLCDRLVEVGEEEGMMEGVARAKTLDAAIELAMGICEGGPMAARQVIACAGLGEDWENAAYEKVVGTRDRNEALEAFAEKRKPVYRGV